MAPKTTISQVADMAGVSIATVSRFINNSASVKNKTGERIMEAITALNYPLPSEFVTPTLTARDRKKIITVNIPSISNPFYNAVLKGIQAAALRHEYHMIVNVQHLDMTTLPIFLNLVDTIDSCGAITLNAMNTELFELLYNKIPFVQCCEFTENQDRVSYTSIDDVQAAKKVTEYLLSTGRKKIGFLSGPMRYKYARHRLNGFTQTLEASGIPIHSEWIIKLPELDFDMAVSSVQQLMLQPDHPNAIFAVSDVLAAAVIRACRIAGLTVPEDVVVSGFDNIDISQAISPAITTINQPKYQLGYMACELLIEKLNNPQAQAKQITLNTDLIIRESTQNSIYL